MKKLLTLAALVAIPLAVFAIDNAHTILTTAYPMWSGGTTNGSSTLSWVIVPAHATVPNAVPVVTSIDAQGDKLAGKVQCYKVLETTAVTNTSTTLTSIPVNSTNTGTKWDSGTVIVRHMVDDTYEKRALTTSLGNTNITLTAVTMEAAVAGDVIYKVTATGGASFGVRTNGGYASGGLSYVTLNGPALVVGQPGMPLLIEIDSTGAVGTMNNVTVRYEPGTPTIPRPGL